jgi:hypothetical protein
MFAAVILMGAMKGAGYISVELTKRTGYSNVKDALRVNLLLIRNQMSQSGRNGK